MAAGPEEPLTWRRWREAPRVCLYPRSLRSTLAVALVVGTVLFAINQLDVVVAGHATVRVWFKVALTYVVPLLVANYGLLIGAHRGDRDHGGEEEASDAVLSEVRRKQLGRGD